MSKSRSSEQQQAPAPQEQPVDMQQSLFGDMMQRQQRNRQMQINQRLERQRGYGAPQGLMNFQQQLPQDWLGLLAMLGQNPAMQGQPMTMAEQLEAQRNGYFDPMSHSGTG